MRCLAGLILGILLALPARADMYQDGSNAKQPQALDNIGKVGGIHYAPAYGSCTWDATHDVGACIQAALAAAAAAGGGSVTLPPGTFGVSSKVVWPQTGEALALRCGPGNVPAATTVLRWIGAAGGRMMEVRAAGGDMVTQPALYQIKAEVHGCQFHSGGLAADGLYVASAYGGHFDDLSFRGNWNGGNVMSLTVDLPNGGSSQNNTIDNLTIFSDGTSNTSNQLLLGAYTNPANGGVSNASVNHVRNLWISNGAGTGWGILCRGCDNNYVSGRVHMNNAVDLTVEVLGSYMFAANGNEFAPFFYSGTFIARGQTTFPACTPYPTCTYSNYLSIDETNATPAPTVEPGAGLHWRSNSGYMVGAQFYGEPTRRPGLVAAQDLSLRGSCPANAQQYGSASTTYLCNSQNSPYMQLDNLNGQRWSFGNAGASAADQNLRLYSSGGGLFEVSDRVQLDLGAAPQSYGGTGLGEPTLPFNSIYTQSVLASNSAHTWNFGLGLAAGSADADAFIEKDGFRTVTFNRFATTINDLVTPLRSPSTGSSCLAGTITADTGFVYVCTATNTWKRAALTAY
jgi:hypothetical protein